MRVNERQEQLVRSKPREWLEIVTTGCHANKWIESPTDNAYRFIAKDSNGVIHGKWLIHAIHISKDFKTAWACVSDNVPYLAQKLEMQKRNESYLIKKNVLKPMVQLISNLGEAHITLETKQKVSNTQFELLLGYFRFWDCLPLATKGVVRNTLLFIDAQGQNVRSGKGSQKLFSYFQEILNAKLAVNL